MLSGIRKRLASALFLVVSLVSGSAWAASTNCNVCGMTIPDKARNHIILESESGTKAPLHVCSSSCLHKAEKHDSTLKKVEVADFNHPDKFLPGDKAFFLIRSSKIKADMGEFAMPPYLGAFNSKEEAEAAHTKYGDGTVVQGIENALK